jgi:Lecithin:cholesterol acyltransferase
MAKAFLLSRVCWMQHLSLNFTTGLDPEGIRVRNAQGLDAIDFFFPGAHAQHLSAALCPCFSKPLRWRAATQLPRRVCGGPTGLRNMCRGTCAAIPPAKHPARTLAQIATLPCAAYGHKQWHASSGRARVA